MDDDNLHTPEGWHIVELEAEIERLRAALEEALMLSGLLRKIFSSSAKPPEEPASPETKEPAS